MASQSHLADANSGGHIARASPARFAMTEEALLEGSYFLAVGFD